jgi:Fe-Mn family superoxide dismutase
MLPLSLAIERLSQRLIESHYENNHGGAVNRLYAITEKLASLDFDATPGYVINGLEREKLAALNSTLLHELYFASLGGDGRKPTALLVDAIARDFGPIERWRSEFVAMALRKAGFGAPYMAGGIPPGKQAEGRSSFTVDDARTTARFPAR